MDDRQTYSPNTIVHSSLVIVILLILALSIGCSRGGYGSGDTTSAVLPISPIAQQTEVWCWAATAEMVFRYYGMPNLNQFGNYQCGVVAAYFLIVGGEFHPCFSNCGLCTAPIANTNELQKLLTGYGQAANFFGIPSRVLRSKAVFGPLPFVKLAEQLDKGRPVMAGVNFRPGFSLPGISQHLVVVIGYDALGAIDTVLVNDPYPYLLSGLQNPWFFAGGQQIQPGQYQIAYDDFVTGLRWDNTVTRIR